MDEIIKRNLELAYELGIDTILLDLSLEQVMSSEAYLDVYHDGKEEAIFRLKRKGEEIKAIKFPYESETLKSGVNYTISQGCFIIYGIKIIKGNGEIEIRGMGGGKPFMVFQGSNVLLARAYVLLSSSPIWILSDKSEIEYRFVGLGFNNPKMEEKK